MVADCVYLYGGGPRGFWIIAVSSVSLWRRLRFSFWRFILQFNHPPSPKIHVGHVLSQTGVTSVCNSSYVRYKQKAINKRQL